MDIFCSGIIFYYLLTGIFPFKALNDEDLIKLNKECKINFSNEIWGKTNQEAKDLCMRMLEKNPEVRISAQEALEHSWINIEINDFNEFCQVEMQEKLIKYNSIYSNKLVELNFREKDFENGVNFDFPLKKKLDSYDSNHFVPSYFEFTPRILNVNANENSSLLKKTLEKAFMNSLEERKLGCNQFRELKIIKRKTLSIHLKKQNKILEYSDKDDEEEEKEMIKAIDLKKQLMIQKMEKEIETQEIPKEMDHVINSNIDIDSIEN